MRLPDEMWHIDTTVIRLLDGTRAYLSAPRNSVAVLLDASERSRFNDGSSGLG